MGCFSFFIYLHLQLSCKNTCCLHNCSTALGAGNLEISLLSRLTKECSSRTCFSDPSTKPENKSFNLPFLTQSSLTGGMETTKCPSPRGDEALGSLFHWRLGFCNEEHSGHHGYLRLLGSEWLLSPFYLPETEGDFSLDPSP